MQPHFLTSTQPQTQLPGQLPQSVSQPVSQSASILGQHPQLQLYPQAGGNVEIPSQATGQLPDQAGAAPAAQQPSAAQTGQARQAAAHDQQVFP